MADYKVTDTELTSIANAIRTKGGTQAQLEFPTGFVSAVQAIPTGSGTTDANDVTYDGSETYDSGTVGAALNEQRNTLTKLEVLVVTIPTSVTIGTTYTSTQVAAIADVEDDMVVLQSVLGTPSAQTADWTVTTGAGSITITSTQTGTANTSLTLYLMKSR